MIFCVYGSGFSEWFYWISPLISAIVYDFRTDILRGSCIWTDGDTNWIVISSGSFFSPATASFYATRWTRDGLNASFSSWLILRVCTRGLKACTQTFTSRGRSAFCGTLFTVNLTSTEFDFSYSESLPLLLYLRSKRASLFIFNFF